MTEIHDWLREADPVPDERGMSAEEIAAMRRRVVAAARTPRGAVVEWKRTLAIAAAVALMAGAGIDTARRTARQVAVPARDAAPAALAAAGRTQLQFSTPGGTRIIWTIDPAFQLTEKR